MVARRPSRPARRRPGARAGAPSGSGAAAPASAPPPRRLRTPARRAPASGYGPRFASDLARTPHRDQPVAGAGLDGGGDTRPSQQSAELPSGIPAAERSHSIRYRDAVEAERAGAEPEHDRTQRTAPEVA